MVLNCNKINYGILKGKLGATKMSNLILVGIISYFIGSILFPVDGKKSMFWILPKVISYYFSPGSLLIQGYRMF